MKKQWLEHFCKYRHICEFLGSEGKEKEEIKEYLMPSQTWQRLKVMKLNHVNTLKRWMKH